MSFTNCGHWVQGKWAHVAYIQGGLNQNCTGYYLFHGSTDGDCCGLTLYTYPIEEVLNITKTVTLHMVAICSRYDARQCNVYNNPGFVYDNYCKDLRAYKYYGFTHEGYVTNITDTIISDDNPDTNNCLMVQSATDMNDLYIILEHNEDISLDSILRGTQCDTIGIKDIFECFMMV